MHRSSDMTVRSALKVDKEAAAQETSGRARVSRGPGPADFASATLLVLGKPVMEEHAMTIETTSSLHCVLSCREPLSLEVD